MCKLAKACFEAPFRSTLFVHSVDVDVTLVRGNGERSFPFRFGLVDLGTEGETAWLVKSAREYLLSTIASLPKSKQPAGTSRHMHLANMYKATCMSLFPTSVLHHPLGKPH
ncbi:hypothetical protein ACJQWK_08796 [Exserohilum turcicum]